jgi:hypothetical protein
MSMTTIDNLAWDAAVEQALRAVDSKLARATCEASRRALTELRFDLTLLLREPRQGDVH